MTITAANEIGEARRRFVEGARASAPASVHMTRAQALTDLLWAHLDEIMIALAYSPGDWANLQRAAAAMTPLTANEEDIKLLRLMAAGGHGLGQIDRDKLAKVVDRLAAPMVTVTTDTVTDADKIREIVRRRRLGLMDWERATLEAIADKLDTRAKDSAEHAAAVAERVGTAEDPTT